MRIEGLVLVYTCWGSCGREADELDNTLDGELNILLPICNRVPLSGFHLHFKTLSEYNEPNNILFL
jgi:hypothetical protein